MQNLSPILVPVVKKGNALPTYQTDGAVGMDLRAHIKEKIWLAPRERVLIPVGLKLSLPPGLEAQVRPRSGLALKHGITVLNAPGTIDRDYRDEIGVVLINLGKETYGIEPNDRVAQLVFAPYLRVAWQEEKSLSVTKRGKGGYGSTGIK